MPARTSDLQAEWRQACQEFMTATGQNLNVRSPTAAQITAMLDRLQEAKDVESQSKVGKAKLAVGNAMRAIQTIGGLLAQGAEMTGFGGPGNVAMNCISFFIDAGFAYQKIADNIQNLFSRIGPIMERMEVYVQDRDTIGSEMELIAHRMLMAVVRTCQHCIGVLRSGHSKRGKAKQFISAALFQDDQDVQAQIDVLVTLQDQETRMAAAVTVTTVKKTAIDFKAVGADVKIMSGGINSIGETLSRSDAITKEERIKKELKEKLGVEDSVLKMLQSQYRDRREKLKPGTCAWLKDDSRYTLWSSIEHTTAQIMLLAGNDGSGKSYAFTSIVQDLEKRYPQGREDSTRISVAYFSFARNAQNNHSNQNVQRESKGVKSALSVAKSAPSVKEMLRTWACQVMENDTFYRKSLHKTVTENIDLDQLDHFAQKLFLDQLSNGAVLFLLLDDTHEMDEDGRSELAAFLEQLSKTSVDLSSLRILITAKPSLQRQLEPCAPFSIVSIELESMNRADMQRHIETKVNALACFKDTSTEIQELKARVVSELPAAVNGNFILVDRKLEEINSCQDEESVRKMIEEMKKGGANMFTSIDKEVSAYNKILNTKQVRILNALLLWVLYSHWEMDVNLLESILHVQEKHKSFQTLAKDLNSQYGAFFNFDGLEDDQFAGVLIKSNAHAEYFKDDSHQRKSTEFSSEKNLSTGQIEVVRHFVQKLCEQDLYDKMGFADFFDQKMQKSEISIAVDRDNAEATISLTCLKALVEVSDTKADRLRMYARVELAEHLKQVDLDIVDPKIKAEIGPLITKLFTDDIVVQSNIVNVERSWAYDDAGLTEVVRILKSSAVTKNLAKYDKAGEMWVRQVLSSRNPEIELLRAQKQAMATMFQISEKSRTVYEAFVWFIGYRNKVESVDKPEERYQEGPLSPEQISSDHITHIFEFEIAPLLTDTGELRSTGVRSMGIVFLECMHVAKAIASFTEALAINPDDILAQNYLADAYAHDAKTQSIVPNWGEALRLKDGVLLRLKNGERLYKDIESDVSRDEILSVKTAWLRNLKRYEEACAILYDSLETRPNNDVIRLELVRTLHRWRNFSKVVELLQNMESEIDESTKITVTSRFLQRHAFDDICHSIVISAFQLESRVEDLKGYYRQAVKDLTIQNRYSQWQKVYLVNFMASMLFKYGTAKGDRAEAIALWEQLVRDKMGNTGAYIRQLCKAYLTQTLQVGPDSPDADTMLGKIKAFLPGPDEDNGSSDISQSEVRSLLARYYRAIDSLITAQEIVRPDMELALKLLSDNDKDNDWQGYQKLADALMDCGSTEEAKAAWSLIQPTQGISHLLYRALPSHRSTSPGAPPPEPTSSTTDDGNKASSSISQDTNAASDVFKLIHPTSTISPNGPIRLYCDGRCGKKWTYADDFYVCCQCIDVQYDEECLTKLRLGQLDRDVCDADHEFLHVPAWTIESANLARGGKVVVGGAVKDINSWLKEIAQKWKLDDLSTRFT